MDLKQLQALIGIADHGSFSAAAGALGTVQSNVSSRVARLERELDATLVERGSGQLTPVGQIVVRRARRIYDELDSMVDDVVSQRSTVAGIVHAGLIGTTGRWLVPALFEVLHAEHPGVQLRIVEGTNSILEGRVGTGQLDLAVLNLPTQAADLSVFPLFTEDLMVVAPSTSPIADRHREPDGTYRPVALRELSQLELLLPIQGTTLRDQIDAAVAPSGVTLTPMLELDGVRMLASLVFDGYGSAILPASAIPSHLRSQFAAVPLEGLPHRTVGVALRRHGLPSAPTRVVVDALKTVVRHGRALPQGIAATELIVGV